jgi:hypothetical protein
MDHGSRRTPDDRFELVSRNVLRWILGPGFLSLHIGVYLIAAVALLLWNFARTPNDVWVDGPLRSWGLVVVFHITAVAVGWFAWRLMRLGETPPVTPQRTPRTGATHSTRPFRGETTAIPAVHAPVLQSVGDDYGAPPADDGVREWLHDSVRVARGVDTDAPAQSASTGSATSAVSGVGITEWGAIFVRRTREMLTSARDHVSPAQHARHAKLNGTLNGVTVPPPPDANLTWPELSREMSLMSESHATPISGIWPTPSNGSMAEQMPLDGSDGSASGYADHTPIDPVLPTPDPNKPIDPAVNEDARWTWVETAAAAWMTRRERDDVASDLPEAPPPPADDATTTL